MGEQAARAVARAGCQGKAAQPWSPRENDMKIPSTHQRRVKN